MKAKLKLIDLVLSPALVLGGKDARKTLARQLWRNRRDKEAISFINRTATWTGYPTK